MEATFYRISLNADNYLHVIPPRIELGSKV